MGFILWHAREWEGKISFIRKVHNFVGVYPSAHQHSNVTHTNLQSWRTVRLERTRWDKGDGARKRLWFPELAQHGIDRVEGGVDLFADLRTEDQHRIRWTKQDKRTLAPVKTILPETKMSKTTLGLIMR